MVYMVQFGTIKTIFRYCPIVCFFPMNLLQTYTCLWIDNRCVDKRKQFAFYKMTMHSPHSQNKIDKQLYKLGSGFGKFKKIVAI